MQPVYKTQIVLGEEKYISIEWRKKSAVTMPSDISYANSCVNVFFILMYNMYIFALKLLIEMLISCIFVNLNSKNFSENIFEIEPMNDSA